MLQSLLGGLVALQTRLKNRSSVHVNDQETKATVIALATAYFNEVRPHLVAVLGHEQVQEPDAAWQELVRLAHANNKRRTYLKLTRRLAVQLRELSVQTLARTAERSAGGQG